VSLLNVDLHHQARQESAVKWNQDALYARLLERKENESPVREHRKGRRFVATCGKHLILPDEENNEDLPEPGGHCRMKKIHAAIFDAPRYAIPGSIDLLHVLPVAKIYNNLPSSLFERLTSGRSHPARSKVRGMCTAG
jgi:hypothetical protein